MKHFRAMKTIFGPDGSYQGSLLYGAKGWAVHNDRGAPLYARVSRRPSRSPSYAVVSENREFMRPRYQSSGVSPSAPRHSIEINRG
jgi:hypothetical protein